MTSSQTPGAASSGFAALPIEKGDIWCFYGSNRSGVEHLLSSLAADSSAVTGTVQLFSFQSQQDIFEEELRNDDSDFLDRIDPGTPAASFIENIAEYDDLIDAFNLRRCLQQGYRQLSSGESRKLLLLGAVSKKPDLLVIESPFDGVDKKGRIELENTFQHLARHGCSLCITVSNEGDIPLWCEKLAYVENGVILQYGGRKEIFKLIAEREKEHSGMCLTLSSEEKDRKQPETELVVLKNGFARYGDKTVFTGLDFVLRRGGHTLITGPNGSGKSTLLHIICGDNQNCYANDLQIMGIQRGSGESIWDLKKHMGIVTPELHRNHYIPGSALQVVVSGFFDSIGVYRKATSTQQRKAIHWLAMTGLAAKKSVPFRRLNYAEQRLCLIARALIKLPPILILDEPTHGLDQWHRADLLAFLELLAGKNICTIIYASHRDDEFRSFFTQHVDISLYA